MPGHTAPSCQPRATEHRLPATSTSTATPEQAVLSSWPLLSVGEVTYLVTITSKQEGKEGC